MRRAEEIADLPVRLALGGSMLYHGLAKLRTPGPEQTEPLFERLAVRPGRTLAIASGLAESFAGVAAILGIGTRPAALAVIGTQAVAFWKVHGPKGFENIQSGIEYDLARVAMALGLLFMRPGAASLHRAAVHREGRRGPLPPWRRARRTTAWRALEAMH